MTSALPLPADQVNQNVLATETPSQAPAQPSPKEQHKVDETAIPIAGKQVKPKQQNMPKTQLHQPPPPQNKAQYGEQAGSSMPHQMQPGSIGPTTVGDQGLREHVSLVCGPDQPQDEQELEQVPGGFADAKGRARLTLFLPSIATAA